jgi:acetolactate synthase I/III small subunit
MRHTLSILVENRYGELARIVGLFAARGSNIESLTVAETLDPAISCVTLVTIGDDQTIERIVKQVDKLVRVLKVADLTRVSRIERELMLIQVHANSGSALHSLLSLVALNRLKVVEVMESSIIFEATGEWSQMCQLVQDLTGLGAVEIVRTGAVAIARRPHAVRETVEEAFQAAER